MGVRHLHPVPLIDCYARDESVPDTDFRFRTQCDIA